MKKTHSNKKRSSFISAIRASKYRNVRLNGAKPVFTKKYDNKRVAHSAHGFCGIRDEEDVKTLTANIVKFLKKKIENFNPKKQHIAIENPTLTGFVLSFFTGGKCHEKYICFKTMPNRAVYRRCNQFVQAYA